MFKSDLFIVEINSFHSSVGFLFPRKSYLLLLAEVRTKTCNFPSFCLVIQIPVLHNLRHDFRRNTAKLSCCYMMKPNKIKERISLVMRWYELNRHIAFLFNVKQCIWKIDVLNCRIETPFTQVISPGERYWRLRKTQHPPPPPFGY